MRGVVVASESPETLPGVGRPALCSAVGLSCLKDNVPNVVSQGFSGGWLSLHVKGQYEERQRRVCATGGGPKGVGSYTALISSLAAALAKGWEMIWGLSGATTALRLDSRGLEELVGCTCGQSSCGEQGK